MEDLEKAKNFILERGNLVERARLNYLLTHAQPEPEAVEQLLGDQRPDGGWAPAWAPDYSSVDATCFRIAQAEQMGLVTSESAITRAITFLAQRQQVDGSWEEDAAVVEAAPPWARPGDQPARLYLTANSGFWMAVLGRRAGDAMKAAGYLQDHLAEEGRLPSFAHTHWLAGALWHRLGWQEPAGKVFDRLERGLADLSSNQLAWLINALYIAGVPTSADLMRQAADRLEQQQSADGRWTSEEGPAYDVHATLEAVRALRVTGRLLD